LSTSRSKSKLKKGKKKVTKKKKKVKLRKKKTDTNSALKSLAEKSHLDISHNAEDFSEYVAEKIY